MDKSVFIFFIFFVNLLFISKATDMPCVFERRNQTAVPCEATLYKGTNCTRTNLKELYPDLYGQDMWPNRPYHFELQPFDRLYKNGRTYPGVNAVISPPKSSSIKDVLGFEINYREMTDFSMAAQRCIVIELGNITLTADDRGVESRFQVEIFALRTNSYIFDLYSLPKPPPDEVTMETHWVAVVKTGKFGWDLNDPSEDWTTTISVYNNSLDGEVQIWFTAPPEKYNFVYFRLVLYQIVNYPDKNEKQVQKELIFNGTSYTFRNVPKGWYRVSVSPHDHLYPSDGCVCKNSKDQCTNNCLATLTEVFYMDVEEDFSITTTTRSSTSVSQFVTGKVSTDKPTTAIPKVIPELKFTTAVSEPNMQNSKKDLQTNNTTEVVGIVLGTLVAAIIVSLVTVLVAVYLCHRMRRRGNSVPDSDIETDTKSTKKESISFISSNLIMSADNMKINKGNLVTEKTVYLVYALDHPLHEHVVATFDAFLRKHCKCKVLRYSGSQHAADGYRWILNAINQSDYIIIINSNAAVQQYETWKSDDEMYLAPPGDTFLVAFREISERLVKDQNFYRNLILVTFEYTKHDIIDLMGVGGHFHLMEELPKFLTYIHGPNSLDGSKTPEIFALGMAISECTLRQENSIRLDSGIYSYDYDTNSCVTDDWKKLQNAYLNDIQIDGISAAYTIAVGKFDGSSVIDSTEQKILENKDENQIPAKKGQYDSDNQRPASYVSEDVFYPPDKSVTDIDIISSKQQEDIVALNERNTPYFHTDGQEQEAISLSGYSV